MIELRALSDKGIDEFNNYIANLRTNPLTPYPNLNVEPFSQEFKPYVRIDERKSFKTRLEIGKYLNDLIQKAGIEKGAIIERSGVWSWLAYLWFDQLSPVIKGSRKIFHTHKYICSGGYREYYRHLVAAAYEVYSLHGERNSKLFLECPVYRHNDFMEQLASRKYIISSGSLVETAHKLYWNPKSNVPKEGARDKEKPGNIRRFVRIIDQLRLTYDLHGIEPDDIVRLLPKEFRRWLRKR